MYAIEKNSGYTDKTTKGFIKILSLSLLGLTQQSILPWIPGRVRFTHLPGMTICGGFQ
jgi:hypothetical protein